MPETNLSNKQNVNIKSQSSRDKAKAINSRDNTVSLLKVSLRTILKQLTN